MKSLFIEDFNQRRLASVAIYLSNEGSHNAYFDHLAINHYQGRVLQIQDYYPFGLAINEGETTGPDNVHNAFKFETNEVHDEVGLNLADFNARHYDYQIGRFSSIDLLADGLGQEGLSPYHFVANNPANSADPWGLAGTGGGGRGRGLLPGEQQLYTDNGSGTSIFKSMWGWVTGVVSSINFESGTGPMPTPMDCYGCISTNGIFNALGGGGSAGGDLTNSGDGGSNSSTYKTTTDAGHGVNGDGGASLGSNYEKDYALMIESATDKWLGILGISNTRTRTTDVKHPDKFSWRYGTANDNGSDAFISFHLNGGTTSDKVFAVYQQDKPNEKESIMLAKYITNELSGTMNVPANPIKSAIQDTRFEHLAVLNNFNGSAGVLIEFGSVQNPTNTSFIGQNYNLIGYKVAVGIYKYFHNGASPTVTFK